MSIYSVERYIAETEKLIRHGGSRNEGALEQEFAKLLNDYCKPKGFVLVPKIAKRTESGKTIIPDGTIKDSLRLDWGYWESKDAHDDLDEEIKSKFRKDYPKDNILFEDHTTAVLFQGGKEIGRAAMTNAADFDLLLNAFVNYERPEVRNFRDAIKKFKEDVPAVVEALRDMIVTESDTNKTFKLALQKFWDLCKESINPAITIEDVREMLIQHILTEEIFTSIFDETQFHKENNIAKELGAVEQTFFTGATKRDTLSKIKHYYDVIKANAAGIADHHEKQKFLKVIYETFYKAYNPKAADRLGIVYTPAEIVRFMVESTDYLLHKHFGVSLGSKNVEILDPATGTGTFICDIIDFLNDADLEYKYKNEIHANEVAILPYYIANLNIEYTYKQRTGKYAEFENICFVDTLDNMGFARKGKQEGMFGLAAENAERIRRQNEKKISVIIGNPPYNANQQSWNEDNKNREYDSIDKRIKETYIKESSAQKTKLYDMYTRFFRWACDRLNDQGVLCFVSNRSFLDTKTMDGFRKVMSKEFDVCYVVDLGGDVRVNPKISGTKHNVFGIQTGVSISFWIRKDRKENAKVFYIRRPEFDTAEDKLSFLSENKVSSLKFTELKPDKQSNWLGTVDNNFESLLPLIGTTTERLFLKTSNGISTNRDPWAYDDEEKKLSRKIKYFTKIYSLTVDGKRELDDTIKWSRDLKNKLTRKVRYDSRTSKIIRASYRPFHTRLLAMNPIMVDVASNNPGFFNGPNKIISVNYRGRDFDVLASDAPCDLHFIGDTACLPLYASPGRENVDNITTWGLKQFQERYADKKITKEEIFHYVYAVLHDPKYRKKYELNLKREFPRIPFYEDFRKWVKWGKQLMELHIGYETVKPYAGIKVTTAKWDEAKAGKPKAKLKADKERGMITLDERTWMEGIPAEAWDYKLGNRSALEWILDQYKEKTPKDPTIREKFNTYKFADYKDKVIDLLKRVTTVSVKTMEIVEEML